MWFRYVDFHSNEPHIPYTVQILFGPRCHPVSDGSIHYDILLCVVCTSVLYGIPSSRENCDMTYDINLTRKEKYISQSLMIN